MYSADAREKTVHAKGKGPEESRPEEKQDPRARLDIDTEARSLT